MRRFLALFSVLFFVSLARAQTTPIHNPVFSGTIDFPGYVNQMFVTDSNGVLHPLIIGANLSYNSSTFTLSATGGGGGGGSPGGTVNQVQTNNGSGGFAGVPVTIDNSGNIVTSGSINVGAFTALGPVTYTSGIQEPIPTALIPIQGRVLTGYLAGSSALTVGELVSMNASGVWIAADDTTGAVARGISVAATSAGQPASVLIHGSFYWTGYSGLTTGSLVWTGPAGTIVGAAPSGSGNIVQSVGFATTANVVCFTFSGEYLTHAP